MMAWPKLRVEVEIKPFEATHSFLIFDIMGKLLHCPCELSKECGTMIGSIKLHRLMYNAAFMKFIHSSKGLRYLLEHYDGKADLVESIHDAYEKLK